MSDMYVMRRANGDLFTDETKAGNIRIPVWPNADATVRYKARNPELLVYLPAGLDHSLIKKIRALGAEGTIEFFLLSDNDPDADLNAGRPIEPEELFPQIEATSQTAHSMT
jgi:hypothetical protein